jgi:hypothetical protein
VDLFDIALMVRGLVPRLFAVALLVACVAFPGPTAAAIMRISTERATAMTERFEHALEPILEPTSRAGPQTDRDR